MTRTRCLLPVSMAMLVSISPALAADEDEQPGSWFPGTFSGSVSVTNNYDYRGITQTDDDPAIQGSIDYRIPTGLADTTFHAGVWGSNVDLNDGDGAQVELRWILDISGPISDTGLSWTLGGLYFSFPARGQYNFWDIPVAISYPIGWFILRLGLNYSPDYFNGSGHGWYPNGGFRVMFPIPEDWFTLAFDAYAGAQWVADNSRFGFQDYRDWKIGFVVGVRNVEFSAYYVDTDLDREGCGGTTNCHSRAVVALTAYF